MATPPSASTGIYGTALSFTLGTTEYMQDIKEAVLSSDEKDNDDATFAETAGGVGADFTLKITAIQSLVATSFHQFLWLHSGETLAFKFSPSGNTTPAVGNPVWSGTATLPTPPDVGGAADPKKEKRYTFDVEMKCEGVTRLVA